MPKPSAAYRIASEIFVVLALALTIITPMHWKTAAIAAKKLPNRLLPRRSSQIHDGFGIKYDLPTIDEKGISTAGGAKAAWFKDTEGNIMALIQTC